MLFNLLFFLLFFAGLLSIVFYTIRYGISPMPSSAKAKSRMLESIPLDTKGIIYELGSGWGSIALPLSSRFPNCIIRAYEISPIPWLVSVTINYLFNSNKNLIIHRKDFYNCSLQDASVVVCYLYPGAMNKLKFKFETELKPGTIIISNTFAIPGWTPNSVYELNDIYKTKIYLYKL